MFHIFPIFKIFVKWFSDGLDDFILIDSLLDVWVHCYFKWDCFLGDGVVLFLVQDYFQKLLEGIFVSTEKFELFWYYFFDCWEEIVEINPISFFLVQGKSSLQTVAEATATLAEWNWVVVHIWN